jgi:hypothetical protein
MIFTATNLISETIAIRAVRNIVAQACPALKAILDHEQISQALVLACADVDQVDPLYLLRTIDTTSYVGQTNPLIKVSNRYYHSHIIAIYHPAEVTDANQVPFDLAPDYQVRPRTTITSPPTGSGASISAVVQWPRILEPIPVTDLPTTDPAFFWADVRAIMSGLTTDDYVTSLQSDGILCANGDRLLYVSGVDTYASTNGIYVIADGHYTRPADADAVDDFNPRKYVRVTEGNLYGDTVWQCTRSPNQMGMDAITFAQITLDSNIDAAQAASQIIPRAAAYLGLQLVSQVTDKTAAAALTAWVTAILARPLPISAQAISQRIYSGTDYAAS